MGLEVALGAETFWQVEKDPYCRAVLAKHWPDAMRFDDVCTVGRSTLAAVDLICGGFPCQDISAAGAGAGLAGARSGLWYEYARLVDELRPEWVIVENVASGASRWVDAVRDHLGQLGYDSLPVPLGAVDVGAPHRRDRIFLVAHASREQLRQQPGGGKPGRTGAPQPVRNGAGRHDKQPQPEAEHGGSMGDADGMRELQSQGSIADERRWAGDAGRWPAEPSICRMAHGVPARSHRLRALGNAVVPQCAQVVGEVIALLCSQS